MSLWLDNIRLSGEAAVMNGKHNSKIENCGGAEKATLIPNVTEKSG